MKKNYKRKVIACLACAFAFTIGATSYFLVSAETNQDAMLEPVEQVLVEDLFEPSFGVTYTSAMETPNYVLNGRLNLTPDVVLKKEDIPSQYYTGLNVNANMSGATAKFKNAIDISDLTKNDSLIEFVPAGERGVADVESITIKMEDAYDPDNFLEFNLFYGMAVYFTCGMSARTSLMDEFSTSYGNSGVGKSYVYSYQTLAGIASKPGDPFTAAYYNQNIYPPFSINYDTATSKFYYENPFNSSRGVSEVFDAKSSSVKVVPDGCQFKGFTNNKVYISITVDTLLAGETNFRIFSIAGIPLNGETVADVEAPHIVVDLPDKGKVPNATTGKPYEIFKAQGLDELCGECDYTVSLKTPTSNEFVDVTGQEYFVPENSGNYILRYESKDLYGNVAVKDITIDTSYGIENIKIDITDKNSSDYYLGSFSVGSNVSVPGYTVSGGSGGLKSWVNVYRLSDKREVEIVDGKFVPTLEGEYEIVYTAEDYVGTQEQRALLVKITTNLTPILSSEINIPGRYISGNCVKLPKALAYDYASVLGVKTNAKYEITVVGENSVEEKIGGDLLFTPSIDKFGNSLTVNYYIYCEAYPEDGITLPFEVELVEGNYLENLFSYNKEELEVSYNTSSQSGYVRFTAKQELETAKIQYIVPLYMNSALLQFKVDYNSTLASNGISSFNWKLLDSENKNQGFEVSVSRYDNTSSYLSYGGMKFIINGGFNSSSGNSSKFLSLKYNNGVLYDYYNNRITTITQNIDGTQFNGFDTKYVYMEVELKNVKQGASVRFETISRLSLAAKYADETLQQFVDNVKPVINVDTASIEKYTLGQEIEVPLAYANDETTSYMEVYVEVYSPTGKKVVEKTLLKKGIRFVLEEFGVYSISYSTTDSKNLKASAIYSLKTSDLVAPTITLKNEETVRCKVGESIVLPEAMVVDDITEEIFYMVFVVDGHTGYYNYCEDFTFTPEHSGKYKIVYYARDDGNNVTIKEISLIVNE